MSRIDKYERIFTPGAPVQSRAHLFGRAQELLDLRDLIRQPGMHPVVVGAKGVGKTSLVRLGLEDYEHHIVACNADWTFDDLARAVLHQLGVPADIVEQTEHTVKTVESAGGLPGIAKIAAKGKQTTGVKARGLGDRSLKAWTLFQLLRQVQRKVVIVIDEYDLVPIATESFHRKVAELIKHLADNSAECDTRVVVVGVGRSAEHLLGEHQSVERSAVEIYLRPLRHKDVSDFLSDAEQTLCFSFLPQVKKAIVTEALGYPYYFHLLGLLCVSAMLARDKKAREVSEADFRVAQRKAAYRAFRSILAKFREAFQNTTPREATIIRELVRQREGHPTRTHLQNTMLDTEGMSHNEFIVALSSLERDKRLLYVSRNKDDVRFSDPLVPLFLRAKYFPQFYPKELAPLAFTLQLDMFDGDDGEDSGILTQ